MEAREGFQHLGLTTLTVLVCCVCCLRYFAFELFDVLKHGLQVLLCFRHLWVGFRHVVLPQLLCLRTHTYTHTHYIHSLYRSGHVNHLAASFTSSFSRSSRRVGGIPSCFALSSSIRLCVAWSLCQVKGLNEQLLTYTACLQYITDKVL